MLKLHRCIPTKMAYTWVFQYEGDDVIMGSGKQVLIDDESGDIIEGPGDEEPV